MAQSLDDLEAKLIAWQQDELYEVVSIVEGLEDEIIEMNQNQLLLYGEDSNGNRVGAYAESTKEIKRSKGQEDRFVTLHDSGDHFDSMYINHDVEMGGEFSIFAKEIYEDNVEGSLVDRYGQRIYGLNESNTEILAAKVQKKLQESFRRKMGIK